MSLDISWHTIKPINGSRHTGFEQLCVQLARRESPPEATFITKGTPDSGVECYARFPNGDEWAWQAKYLHSSSSITWSQVDRSVKAALKGHPALTRYYVCMPIDLPDGRKKGSTSAYDRWKERVSKWKILATQHGMQVDFCLWDNSQLIERLASPQNVGLIRFWFDKAAFTPDWFKARLEEAIKAAGPRYTPETHIDLPISGAFDAFGRHERILDIFKNKIRQIRTELQDAIIRQKAIGTRVSSQAGEVQFEWSEETLALSKTMEEATLVVLADLEKLTIDPIESLPFEAMLTHIGRAIRASSDLDQHVSTVGYSEKLDNHISSFIYEQGTRIFHLNVSLCDLDRKVDDISQIASRNLMLVTGKAGSGKTHLLCDIARSRLQEGRPTILLMGNRFLEKIEPWRQALNHLDLSALSVFEFVGALEAAAQAANYRALILIDALNEGVGKDIWPSHLAPFLAAATKSKWISVCLSIRTPSEHVVIPEEIRNAATLCEHEGFSGCEYDAMNTFFKHYGIIQPSTPLLNPEFSNPLFLKVLCKGLRREGELVHLPRGSHGITAIFDLYLNSINTRLATKLEYREGKDLVGRAIELFVDRLIQEHKRFIYIEYAEDLINSLLPGRSDEESLFTALVREGVFIEIDAYDHPSDSYIQIVQIGYERLADYLLADRILEPYSSLEDLHKAFDTDSPLSPIFNVQEEITHGLFESLCVLVPERFGVEVTDILNITNLKDADIVKRIVYSVFRPSVIWRSPQAITESTKDTLAKITRDEQGVWATLETILTVATISDHPFNAFFLHEKLSRLDMPERDARWSIYLHSAWGKKGSVVHRLIDWTWTIERSESVSANVVELAATSLTWMLTTSNRHLRDRVTKALVSLLTGRHAILITLLRQFADVNDPYVSERLYAVAYGCVMRSHDPKEAGELAQHVYELVFRDGNPPVHVLLRDYARGVIERALYLDSVKMDFEPELVRPPYKSDWPPIPAQEEVEQYNIDISQVSPKNRDMAWAKSEIISSVMKDGDFGHYVIGTHTDWLTYLLSERSWHSPSDRLAAFKKTLNSEELDALQLFENAESTLKGAQASSFGYAIFNPSADRDHVDTTPTPLEEEIHSLQLEREAALRGIKATFSKERLQTFHVIWNALQPGSDDKFPSKLDIELIKRYVVWRVFDLGWTGELFGDFDNNVNGRFKGSRGSKKAERIGKKYQWIAYHEILARIADRFQYYDEHYVSRAYDGPWQVNIRDIDPSCTLTKTAGRAEWQEHNPFWWAPIVINDWTNPESNQHWFAYNDDLPTISPLLISTEPETGTQWLSLNSSLTWNQPHSSENHPQDHGIRQIWHIINGYILPIGDVNAFMEWAKNVNFYGRWMPESQDLYQLFLGEMNWSPAAHYFSHPYYGDDGWTQPRQECPVKVRVATTIYSGGTKDFDCSVDDSFSIRLPVGELVDIMQLKWSGHGGDFLDINGQLGAQDPTVDSAGPHACLVRLDILQEALKKKGLGLCWTLLGEKRYLKNQRIRMERVDAAGPFSMAISGAYTLEEDKIKGFTNCYAEHRRNGSENPYHLISTLRTDTRF